MRRVMIAAVSFLVGCSGSGACAFNPSCGSWTPGPPSDGTWRGVIGATGVPGTFDLTSTGTVDVRPLTGSVKFGVTTTLLTGTWTLAGDTANGGAYMMTALAVCPIYSAVPLSIYGTYTGAGSGSFAAWEAATAADFTHYCDSYTERVGCAATRYWIFSVKESSFLGTAATSTAALRLTHGARERRLRRMTDVRSERDGASCW